MIDFNQSPLTRTEAAAILVIGGLLAVGCLAVMAALISLFSGVAP
ncbi:MAG: hypothetical protein RLY20_881 [Verrucomicrobiota bacterium]|jgi:hypothetical protein